MLYCVCLCVNCCCCCTLVSPSLFSCFTFLFLLVSNPRDGFSVLFCVLLQYYPLRVFCIPPGFVLFLRFPFFLEAFSVSLSLSISPSLSLLSLSIRNSPSLSCFCASHQTSISTSHHRSCYPAIQLRTFPHHQFTYIHTYIRYLHT